tara:strand:- start:1597 stop:1833 length:237 start_codon:yes stop_codon:yes gene_type:complete
MNEISAIFNNKETFGLEIEKLVQEEDTSYIDAVIYYCEQNDIDYNILSKLIDNTLKAKIELEAREKNFLTNKVNTLPL